MQPKPCKINFVRNFIFEKNLERYSFEVFYQSYKLGYFFKVLKSSDFFKPQRAVYSNPTNIQHNHAEVDIDADFNMNPFCFHILRGNLTNELARNYAIHRQIKRIMKENDQFLQISSRNSVLF